MPPNAPAAKVIAEWAKKIELNTNGRVRITVYPSESLAKGKDVLSLTNLGICDISYVAIIYEPSKLSLNRIINLAALPIPTDKRGSVIWEKLWDKYPQVFHEFEGTKPLFDFVTLPNSLHTKTAVRVPNDIKGMRIAAVGDSTKLLQAAGATPIDLPINDWYSLLEQSAIDGVLCPIGPVTDRGLQAQVRNHIDLGIGQGGNLMIINQERWNSFPEDIKAEFEKLNSWATEAMIKANVQVEADGWQQCHGQNIVKPSGDEMKVWLAATQPAANDWIKANESKGPSREMVEYTIRLIEETQ
jgi:TRAP-type C4-dicarboxylate transport system substrate-binding protein